MAWGVRYVNRLPGSDERELKQPCLEQNHDIKEKLADLWKKKKD